MTDTTPAEAPEAPALDFDSHAVATLSMARSLIATTLAAGGQPVPDVCWYAACDTASGPWGLTLGLGDIAPGSAPAEDRVLLALPGVPDLPLTADEALALAEELTELVAVLRDDI